MSEKWKKIDGFPYSVSDLGRVRRDEGGRGGVVGRILTPKVNRKGYCHVDLSGAWESLLGVALVPCRREHTQRLDVTRSGDRQSIAAQGNARLLRFDSYPMQGLARGAAPSKEPLLCGLPIYDVHDLSFLRRRSSNDKKTRRLIHQLVAEAFLGKRPTDHHHPNHLDADKTNNRASNLEWATNAENNAHARSLGLIPAMRGENNGRSKLTADQVAEIRALKGRLGQRVIADRFGVARSMVQRIHQGKAWSSSEWPPDLRVRQFPEARGDG